MPISSMRAILLLLALGLLTVGGPLGPPTAAAPPAQAQPSPSPEPTAEPSQDGPSREERSAQRGEELERRKLRNEVELLDLQKDRLRQQMAIDGQPWRAAADAVSKVGPTLVGLGLLYLLARALAHWLPPRPAEARPSDPYDDEEDEL